MLDRLMALLAVLTLGAFLGIVFFKVWRWDLGIVIIIGMSLVVYDVASQLFRRRRQR